MIRMLGLILLIGLIAATVVVAGKQVGFINFAAPKAISYVGRLQPQDVERCKNIGIVCKKLVGLSVSSKPTLVAAVTPKARKQLESFKDDPNVKLRIKGTLITTVDPKTRGKSIVYLAATKVERIVDQDAPQIENRPSVPLTVFGLAGFSTLTRAGGADARGNVLVDRFLELGARGKNDGIRWKDFEPTVGSDTYPVASAVPPVWGNGDGHQLECARRGMRCNLQLHSYPNWAMSKAIAFRQFRGFPGPCDADPINPEFRIRLGDFAQKVAERFDGDGIEDAPESPKVYSMVFLNEPDQQGPADCGFPIYGSNLDLNQNGKPDYEDYAEDLKAFYDGVKRAFANNPSGVGQEVKVAFGGMVAEGNPTPESQFSIKVMEYSKRTYGRQFFDLMNFHYYADWANNGQKSTQLWRQADSYSSSGVRGKTVWFRNFMERIGWVKPIIITELGYCGGGDLEKQARVGFKLMAQTASAGIDTAFWYTLVQQQGCNLVLSTTYSPLPLFNVYKTFQAQIADGFVFDRIDTENENYIEGYVFKKDSTYKEVVWYRKKIDSLPDKSEGVFKKFNADKVVVVKKSGESQEIVDGSQTDADHLDNGSVSLHLSEDPVIVSY